MRPLKALRGPGTAVVAAILVAVVWTSSDGREGSSTGEQRLTPAGPVTRDAGTAGTVDYDEALQQLTVAAEEPHEGYDRGRFDLYQDADGDGCDARREVLIAQALTVPRVRQPGCELDGGEWVSPYDGERLADARDVQIDHMVALAEAWQSGARSWETSRLVEFGSFLEDPGHLVAVSGASNQAKGEKDPAEWLPSNRRHVCRYLADWVGVKLRWALTVDEREMRALQAFAGSGSGECGGEPVRVG